MNTRDHTDHRVKRWPTRPPTVLAAAVAVVALAVVLAACGSSAATVAKRPGWSSLTAVKAHHVIGLNDDIASRWGPRLVDLLRTVLAALKGA